MHFLCVLKVEWDLDQVKEFAKAYPDFATMNAFFKEEIQLEKKYDKSLPTISKRTNTLDVVRMTNEKAVRGFFDPELFASDEKDLAERIRIESIFDRQGFELVNQECPFG